MRITQEADYALRIVDTLARTGERTDARTVSERAGVSLRFALKILRKLVFSGMIRSFKGLRGGYEVAKPLEEITVREVLETIDGPIALNRCVLTGSLCDRDREPDKTCPYHYLFEHVSDMARAEFEKVTLAAVLSGERRMAAL